MVYYVCCVIICYLYMLCLFNIGMESNKILAKNILAEQVRVNNKFLVKVVLIKYMLKKVMLLPKVLTKMVLLKKPGFSLSRGAFSASPSE